MRELSWRVQEIPINIFVSLMCSLTPLIQQLTEAALQGELDAHLSDSSGQNCRNGYSRKRVQPASGSFDLETPRDSEGSFEP